MAIADLTASRLRELLTYDQDIGVFTRRITVRRYYIGTVAGGVSHDGYYQISIDNVNYRGHRLAWLHVHGRWPDGEIDHINGLRHDNRMANLRDTAHAENLQNRVGPVRNQTGFRGVKKRWKDCYEARVRLMGEQVHYSLHTTAEEASRAYETAKAKWHPFSKFAT